MKYWEDLCYLNQKILKDVWLYESENECYSKLICFFTNLNLSILSFAELFIDKTFCDKLLTNFKSDCSHCFFNPKEKSLNILDYFNDLMDNKSFFISNNLHQWFCKHLIENFKKNLDNVSK